MEKVFKLKKEIIFIIVFFIFMMFLSSCGLEKLTSIEVNSNDQIVYIGDFDYHNYKVILNYDDGKTEEVELTEDMISEVDRLKLFIEGKHEIKVTYKEKETKFNITVKRNVFEGVVFDDVETVYNGQDVIMTVKNVPEGTTVSYPGSNKFRNAGTYDVKAILRKDSYEAKEISAKLVIKKADYDLSSIKFEDMVVDYDGLKHNLKIDGQLPDGLAVDYTITKEGGKEEVGNSATNAGTYVVKANFSGDYNNYNYVEPKYATLTINKAVVDMSSVEFYGDVITYDRQSHNLAIEGTLPIGVSVSYENNNHIDVGEYQVKAKFVHRDAINYEPISDMVANLIIDKADYDLSDIHFDSISVDYDGEEKSLVLTGDLPTHLKYTFENNGHTDSGTYEVIVKFNNDDPNYNTPSDLKAQIVINPIVANLEDVIFDKTRFVGYYVFSYDEDVYIEANNFRPTNLPVGLEIENVVYYKQDGLLTGSLDAFDGVSGDFVDKITEDGYYVAVANFKETINYKDVHPVKTQIKTTTAAERYVALSGYYDASWGWNTNLSKKILADSLIYFEYDDCSVLTELLDNNGDTSKLHKHGMESISEPLLVKFNKLGIAYSTISSSYFDRENMATENNEFMTNMYLASEDLFLSATDDITNRMLKDKMQSAIFGINNSYDILTNINYVYVKTPKLAELNSYFERINGVFVNTEDTEINESKTYYRIATYDDYLLMIAKLFGYEIYENNNDLTIQKFIDNVNLLANAYLADKDINNPLSCDGAVYTTGNCFILPYVYDITLANGTNDYEGMEHKKVLVSYLIISDDGKVSFWVNDVATALDATNLSDKSNSENNILTTFTRCALFETREKGAYCIAPHDAVILNINGVDQIMQHGDNILEVDIDNADYASTSNGKMCFKLLTELPEGAEIDNKNFWSYEDFVQGIVLDGNHLSTFDERFSAFIDQYHGVIEVYDVVMDEYGNWLDFKVIYADPLKPIVAVQGIKDISGEGGEFLVYVDLVDTEGFKMNASWYATLIIWEL